MIYVTFHGDHKEGCPGGKKGLNSVYAFDEQQTNPALNPLPCNSNVDVAELRGMIFSGNMLFVCNGYKSYNNIIAYEKTDSGFTPPEVFTGGQDINGILHPYGICADNEGNIYVSSQDTNVVTGIEVSSLPIPMNVSPWLKQNFPSGIFLDGTIVASDSGLPGGNVSPTPVPDNLGGLQQSPPTGSPHHSVRGIAFAVVDGVNVLFVASEAGNCVNMYETSSGNFLGKIIGNVGAGVTSPVTVLWQNNSLYVGCSDSNIVLQCSSFTYTTSPQPAMECNNVVVYLNVSLSVPDFGALSGFTFDASGNFYFADRTGQNIYCYNGISCNAIFGTDTLTDQPECLLWMAT